MADKILKDEILSDELLDEVAGGYRAETQGMVNFLKDHGVQLHGSDSHQREKMREILWHSGVQIKDHNSSANEYYQVNTVTGEYIRKIDHNTALVMVDYALKVNPALYNL